MGGTKNTTDAQDAATYRALTHEWIDRCESAEKEIASLRAQLAAASDRYARAVAGADEVRGRLEAERDQLGEKLHLMAHENAARRGNLVAALDAALADVARLKAERDEARGKALEIKPGSPQHVELWDAINDYATACHGHPESFVYGNTSRHKAVSRVEAAVRALATPAAKGGA